MTDPPNHPEISDLLREAGDAGPMPTHVAARLDAVIAGLAADRTAGPVPETNVVPLRRRVPRFAAAAAAVALLVGGGAVASGLLGQHHATNGPSAASREASGNASSRPNPEKSGERSLQGLTDSLGAAPLRGAHLRSDVRALLGSATADDFVAPGAAPARSPVSGCRGPADVAAGDLERAVTLDGTPGVLVVRRRQGSYERAQVYACDGGTVLAATRLTPAP